MALPRLEQLQQVEHSNNIPHRHLRAHSVEAELEQQVAADNFHNKAVVAIVVVLVVELDVGALAE